jgi:two-component system, chemotaxis family, CheB/CheR fusion protein
MMKARGGLSNTMNPEPSSKPRHTVVGIGASAGGLAALKIFLEHVPPDSGLSFVVVVHLSPDHESHLAELLQPHVRLPVEQVNQTKRIEPNSVYIIPPNANLNAIDTHLRLTKLEERRKERAPIDHFFRTLAGAHDGHAVAVVLTGTGSDGTLGVKDIKANGGVVIVQDPTEAEYDGMPQSAIATGLVDFVLPVAEIPASILRFDRVQPRLPLPTDEGDVQPDELTLLYKIFAHLRVRTNRDFSRYKRSTVLRRIARRMQLNYIEDLAHYIERLRERPEEARALADDLLITVTHFFRDPEVFERLEKVEIARIFSKRTEHDSVRAWSVGCATGEEAYSVAMLLLEEASKHETPPLIQVFASDLHSRSLDRAREGFYPGDIATDVSAERLKRFFQKENGGYRIRKEVRDLVVFAPHNLLADPPFSRLDLISCRNLLIYLEREVQQDVIELFHYALNPEGTLLVGSAETIDASDLFRVEDKKLCLFRKRNVPPREPHLPVFPLTRSRFGGDGGAYRPTSVSPMVYGALHQRMVEKYAPPSILIGADNKVLHLSEHAGRYLILPGGEPTQSALKMVREELRVELQTALHHAREKKETFDSKPIPVKFNGHPHPVVLHVRPSLEYDEEGFALVIFEEREPTSQGEDSRPDAKAADSEQVRQLENELSSARQRSQIVIEEYETSKEEMKASNEEMQSTNEELRSTMEELETSKEELQSINEELQTVNQQNRHKVEELALLSSDLQNLLAATDIATLFLDRELRILRFTPKLGDLFNVRATDRGRPISDLTHRLGYANLIEDAQNVLNSLVPAYRELQDDAGKWYLTRVNPYRTHDDRIEGIVVTFVDITDRKEAEEIRLELQKREQSVVSEKALRAKEVEIARVSRTLMVGELATSIAHEVNQPLAGMVTNAEAGLRWLNSEPANLQEARNSFSLIARDGKRASAVISRVRDFVKHESNGSAALDISEVIRETIELLKFDLHKNKIELNLAFSDNVSLVRGNRIQLEQVVMNLIVNAIEAMSSIEDRRHELKISVSDSADRTVVVSIRDSGVGIDPAQIGKIYDAFFTTKPSGIGMGLSISRSIVEAHGGRIVMAPNGDYGLNVHFSLPAVGSS